MSTHNIGFYEDLTKIITEAILMSTHNIGFYEDLTKIIFELSSILTLHYHFYHCTYRKRHRVKINDNSRLTKLRAKQRAFVTSHVNIYVRRK